MFREVRRVLADDGVLWINVGDSWAGGGGEAAHVLAAAVGAPRRPSRSFTTLGYARKSLHLIPQRLAVALQDDGWIVRSWVVRAKESCLPDPARDRPAASHEAVLMLVKSARYRYDAAAVAEPASPRGGNGTRNCRDVWRLPSGGGLPPGQGDHPAPMPVTLAERCLLAASRPGDRVLDPFSGGGTTGVAALRHGRAATLIELGEEYADAARKRLAGLA